MQNTVITDSEKGTISGVFHVLLPGSQHEGSFLASITISGMTPEDCSNIHEKMATVANELIRGIARHAVNR
ncbi:MAG: hypothetical protein K0Q59_1785 [Paenibacillus sp.]|jgi:hypothetical protein|nr:hypothetical protein [Paenibacillus sp.]